MAQWDGIMYTGPSHAVIAPERMEELLAITDRDILLHGENSVNVMIFPLVFGRLNAPFASDRSSLGFITSDAERCKWLADLPYESPSYTNRFFRDFVVMQANLAQAGITLELDIPDTAHKTAPHRYAGPFPNGRRRCYRSKRNLRRYPGAASS